MKTQGQGREDAPIEFIAGRPASREKAPRCAAYCLSGDPASINRRSKNERWDLVCGEEESTGRANAPMVGHGGMVCIVPAGHAVLENVSDARLPTGNRHMVDRRRDLFSETTSPTHEIRRHDFSRGKRRATCEIADSRREQTMRHAAKTDGNQTAIVDHLRAIGFEVHVLKHPADLLIARNGYVLLVEVKDPAQPPCGRHLTPAEMRFWLRWRVHGLYLVVQDASYCEELKRAIRTSHIADYCDARMRDYFIQCYTPEAMEANRKEHKAAWSRMTRDLGL